MTAQRRSRRRPKSSGDISLRRFSGRYVHHSDETVAPETMRLTLHVDIDGTQPLRVISGEVRTGSTAEPSQHFIGRVKRRKNTSNGLFLWVEDLPLRLLGSDAPRFRLKVKIWQPVDSNQSRCTVWFLSPFLRVGPFHLVRATPWFRQVEIEIDREQGARKVEPYLTDTHPDRPPNLPGRLLTLETVFEEAGVQIVRSTHNNVISSSEAGEDRKWSNAELHDAMTVHWEAFANQPQWKIWVLLANRSERPRLGGIVINANIDEASGINRQGAAVFTRCDYFFSPKGGFCRRNLPSSEASKRELFFTLVHEIGHSFNLTHPTERVRGQSWRAPSWAKICRRIDALTFMSLPNLATPGGSGANASWFYRRFYFKFERPELLFIRHAADRYVEMGRQAWNASHARVATDELDNRLDFRVCSPKLRYEQGEPVVLELRLRNVSDIPILAHKNLALSDRFVELAITDPNGIRRPFITLEQTDTVIEQLLLEPKGTLYGDIDLTVGRGGFPFKQPGTYLIEVTYMNLDGTGVSAALRVQIRSPSAEQALIVRELFDARVGRVMYFGGTRVLHDVNERLDWIRSHLGRFHPVSIHIAAARFQALARSGRVFDRQSGREQLIPYEPDLAVELITDLVMDRADTTANTMGHIHYRRMIDEYTTAALLAGRYHLAVKAQRRLLALFEQRKVQPGIIGEVKTRLAEIDSTCPLPTPRLASASNPS